MLDMLVEKKLSFLFGHCFAGFILKNTFLLGKRERGKLFWHFLVDRFSNITVELLIRKCKAGARMVRL